MELMNPTKLVSHFYHFLLICYTFRTFSGINPKITNLLLNLPDQPAQLVSGRGWPSSQATHAMSRQCQGRWCGARFPPGGEVARPRGWHLHDLRDEENATMDVVHEKDWPAMPTACCSSGRWRGS